MKGMEWSKKKNKNGAKQHGACRSIMIFILGCVARCLNFMEVMLWRDAVSETMIGCFYPAYDIVTSLKAATQMSTIQLTKRTNNDHRMFEIFMIFCFRIYADGNAFVKGWGENSKFVRFIQLAYCLVLQRRSVTWPHAFLFHIQHKLCCVCDSVDLQKMEKSVQISVCHIQDWVIHNRFTLARCMLQVCS